MGMNLPPAGSGVGLMSVGTLLPRERGHATGKEPRQVTDLGSSPSAAPCWLCHLEKVTLPVFIQNSQTENLIDSALPCPSDPHLRTLIGCSWANQCGGVVYLTL